MTDEEKREGLWRNCENSIRHALEHFSAGSSENDAFHHHKWALLSVAHAAEVYGNLLLCVFNPKHPDNKRGDYPSLDGVREELKSHPRLTEAERYVFDEVFAGVAGQRNTLLHMPAPEVPEVTSSAKALLALLHIVRRRTGLSTKEFFDQNPPVEQDVFDHIAAHDHQGWFTIAEKLALAEYGGEHLEGCDNFGAFALPPDARCRACFHENDH
jgi:hypothetical protein